MKSKWLLKLLCTLLALIMATQFPLQIFASEASQEEETLYIKSVMLSHAGDEAAARTEIEGAGYIFLNRNLNQGTGQDAVYLGYTTTANPAEAIYDLKLMNMKGGFTLTSMEQALQAQTSAIAEMAADMMLLVEEFADAYDQGSIAAMAAYQSLNFFRIREENGTPKESNGLGYQLVRGNISLEEMTEIILFCDTALVDCIVRMLTTGIQAKNENWLQKLSEVGPYDYNLSYGEDEVEMQRRAEALLPMLQFYAQAYNAMEKKGIVSGEFNDKGEIEGAEYQPAYDMEAEDSDAKNLDISRYQLYKLAFDELEKYPYGDGTLKDFFCSLEDAYNEKLLFPLLSVLSDGEFAALSYGCVLEVIIGADADASAFETFDEVLAMLTEEVDSLYLYAGVNEALLDKDTMIAFTDEANRHMAATGEVEFFEKESRAEDQLELGKQIAQGISCAGMLLFAACKLLTVSTMVVKWTFSLSAIVAAGGPAGAFVKFLTAVSGLKGLAIMYALVALTYALSYLAHYLYSLADNKIDWDENPIPEYIYDVREVTIQQSASGGGAVTDYCTVPSFLFYEVVRNADGKPVDLNGFSDDASQWLALYVSYDVPGDLAKPIRAEDLLVQTGDGQTPEGYTPLSEFGENIAQNLNSYDDRDSVNGVYMFYQQETKAAEGAGRTLYISDVYLQAGESPEHCMRLLEAAGYTPVNVNLSPDFGGKNWFDGKQMYSYVGYKTTTNENNAIRDLRMAYNMSASPFNYGGVTYAECGTAAGVTLYASKFVSTGTPLLAGGLLVTRNRTTVPAGYEPVNLFSGGPAMTFNTHEGRILTDPDAQYYLYFLPETTFTEGESYLSGITYAHASVMELAVMARANSTLRSHIIELYEQTFGYSPSLNNQIDIVQHAWSFLVMQLYASANPAVSTEFEYTYDIMEGFICYPTYNPYRAVYSIKATALENTPPNIALESLGYAVVGDLAFSASLGIYKSCGYDIGRKDRIDLDGYLYLAGNPAGNTYSESKGEMSKTQPIKMSALSIVSDKTDKAMRPSESSGFLSLTDMYSTDNTPLRIKNKDAEQGYYFYLHEDADREELPYISNIYIADTASIFRAYGGAASGIKQSDISSGIALSYLARAGASHFCSHSTPFYGWVNGADIKREYEVNRLYYGFSKTDKATSGYTDLFLYYGGINAGTPPDELYRGTVKYTLVCELSAYNFSGYEDNIVPRIYLYGTTSKKAGERIIDFTVSSSPFKEGYETVRSYNGGSLWDEILTSLEKEEAGQSHYIGSGVIDSWIDFFTLREDEDYGRWNSGIYLHFQREGDSIDVQKPYISEIYVEKTDDNVNAVRERLFAKGADGYITKDLNAGTIGDKIYIGYKLTGDIDDAIRDIRASHSKSHPDTKKDSYNITYTLASDVDLNAGCGIWSDYIYLYYTKDIRAGTPVRRLTTSDSIKNGYETTESEDGYIRIEHINETVKKWDSTSASDLNEDAYGDYIYLIMIKKDFNSDGTYEEPNYGKAKTYTRKTTEGSENGAYIAALYVMDKNTLRQEKLAQGVPSSECECRDISDEEVVNRLYDMGATTVIETPLLSRGEKYSGFGSDNANKVFIGYSRTDNARLAIKGIVLHTMPLSNETPEETIYVDKKSYKLVAEQASKVETLPPAINLIGLEDAQDALAPRIYLYATTSGTEPIHDICIDSSPLLNGWNTACSQNGTEAFADLSAQSEVIRKALKKEGDDPYVSANFTRTDLNNWLVSYRNLFDAHDRQVSSWYIHVKRYAEESITETKPYIGELFLASGSSREEALIRLLEFNPDGYIDCNLNKGAGGEHIYLGYRCVDNLSRSTAALTDIVIFRNVSPTQTQRVPIGDGKVTYQLTTKLNLNEGAGGDKLYLYTTTDTRAGAPIDSLDVQVIHIGNSVDEIPESLPFFGATYATISGRTTTPANLNRGAGVTALYLTFTGGGSVAPDDADSLPASMVGTGSIIAIVVLALTGGITVTLLLLYKKKHAQVPQTNNNDKENPS